MNAKKIYDFKAILEDLKSEISVNKHLFDQWTYRQEYENTAHRHTKCIPLRMGKGLRPDTEKQDITEFEMFNELEFLDWPNRSLFPTINACMLRIMNALRLNQLGWLTIVSLKPKSPVYEHIDQGEYCRRFHRFHIPIFNNGAEFYVEEERVDMKEGELWWFANKKPHRAYNSTDDERIHIIFDAR